MVQWVVLLGGFLVGYVDGWFRVRWTVGQVRSLCCQFSTKPYPL